MKGAARLSTAARRVSWWKRHNSLGLRVPHKLIDSNKIDWFITEQYSPQCNILEALEPT
jgi:hypothetical protein